MAVRPEEIAPQGFGLSTGRYLTAEEIAAFLAETGRGPADQLLAQIEDAGFRQQYAVGLLRPREDGAEKDARGRWKRSPRAFEHA